MTTFSEIRPGNIFYYAGWIYVKCNAYAFEGGNAINQVGGMARFYDDERVFYVKELHELREE